MVRIRKYAPGEGYLIIERIMYVNRDGIPLPSKDETPCVICGGWGFVLAPETNEVLCKKCMLNNDEARRRSSK